MGSNLSTMCSGGDGMQSPYIVVTNEDGTIVARPRDSDHVANIENRGKQIATDPTDHLEIPVAAGGLAGIEPTTLTALFKRASEQRGDEVALRWEVDGVGVGTDNEGFDTLTWSQYYTEAKAVAQGMIALGVKQFDTVSIMGFNSKYWLLSQMGAVMSGGKSAGIYGTNGPAESAYIVNHAKSQVVMVENNATLKRFIEAQDTLETVKAIVVWGEAVAEENTFSNGIKTYNWTDFLKAGADKEDELQTRLEGVQPSHGCQLIYTSGTTGSPKAVMCSHDNLWYEAKSVLATNLLSNFVSEDGQLSHYSISFLPLSHVAGNLLDVILPIACAGEEGSQGNVVVTFARPDAMRGTLKKTLQKVRPTVFLAVPRVWEKFREAMMKMSKDKPPSAVLQKVMNFAKEKGMEQFNESMAEATDEGGLTFTNGSTGPLRAVAGALHNKVQKALGLDRCAHNCVSAAAPISKDTIEFFGQFGIHIHEAYGMSESSGATSVADHGSRKTLCLGLPVAGCEIMIAHDKSRDKPGEGEICFRGRHVMMGYMHDDAKTKETIDEHGWLHSGDVGRVDNAGRIYITGRIKELIITAGGENIAPVPIEDAMLEFGQGVISNIMLVGDRMKFNTVLITLKHKFANAEPTGELNLAELQKTIPEMTATTPDEANDDPALKKYVENLIKNQYNPSAVSNAQKIQKFTVVPEFSLGGGELTPTLKLKRAVVLKKYAAQVELMYMDAAPPAKVTTNASAYSTKESEAAVVEPARV